MKNKIFGLICALATAATMQAQTVQKVTVGDNQNYGITYTLPKTVIKVTVNATKTSTTAGVYGPYAEKYLGLTDVATSDRIIWEINSITLDGVAAPDTAKTYHIDFSEKGGLPEFYFSDEGMLLSINRAPEVEPSVAVKESETPKKLTLKASDVMSEDILRAASKAKQAELTAREIFSIRESRRNLLKGDVDNMPADGASFQLILDNLDAQEQALMSLFVGVSTSEVVTRTFEYVPTGNVKNEVMFRFSRFDGCLDRDDVLGNPCYISVNILEDNRMAAPVADPKKKGIGGFTLPSTGKSLGIAFSVPGKMSVSLKCNETVIEKTFQCGQFGHVEQLPVNQFTDKKKMASASFNPLTGSIKIYE